MAADGLTLGIEEEFLLVRPDGHLAWAGPDVVEASHDPDGTLQVEFTRCQVESATGICTTAQELLAQLQHLRAELAAKAATRGLRLLPSGTPVLGEDVTPDITPRPRYQRMAALVGAIAGAAPDCACHVHVHIPDRTTGIRISNHVRPWLPVLLALTANSPYCDGHDTGYSSWRHVQWSLWPSSGPPPLFESLAHYEDSVEAIMRSGAMMDRGMVYWYIRLSDWLPTLEVRVSDVAATVEEAALLGIVVRGLVAGALRDIDRGVPAPPLRTEVLRAYLWRAAHDGLAGHCPSPPSGELIPGHALPALLAEQLRPVLDHDDFEFIRNGLAALSRAGGGAQRQRAVYARHHRLTEVVNELVHRSPS